MPTSARGLLQVSNFLPLDYLVSFSQQELQLTLFLTGGGETTCSHLIGLITHEPTLGQTCQWSVNLSLSVTVTLKKKLGLYVSRFNYGGP